MRHPTPAPWPVKPELQCGVIADEWVKPIHSMPHQLFPFAHWLILVSFASDTMPEEHNFLHHITGSFAQPAAENPTVEMVEAAYRHHGLHYRYLNTEVPPE